MFVEKWINRFVERVLSMDERALLKLQPLYGTSIAVRCLAPFMPVIVCTASAEDGLVVTFGETQEASVSIAGTPWQLALAVMQQVEGEKKAPLRSDVVIQGDVICLQAWMRYFAALDLDFEELMSRYAGDVPVHYAAEWNARLRQFLAERRQTFAISVHDYLHDEATLLASSARVEEYIQAVDVLKHDTARLEARLAHLRSVGKHIP